jgi:small subunit ribosomal protein S19
VLPSGSGTNNIRSRSNKISVWSRKSIILPLAVGKNLDVYDGKKFVTVRIVPEMIGHKLGEFCLTRKLPIHKKS